MQEGLKKRIGRRKLIGPQLLDFTYRAVPVAAALLLSGCFGLDRFSRVEPVTTVPETIAVDLDEFKLPGEENLAFTEAKNSEKSRNELQSAILRRSERACENHKASIYTNAAIFNVSTGFLTSALAGAGAIVTGQTATSILAGGAALTNSTRSLVNEEVYQQMISSAIIAEIDQIRKTSLEEIYTKRIQDITIYTIEDAILDAEQYNNSCSFYHGIASLVEKAGKEERTHEYVIEKSQSKLKIEKSETLEDIENVSTQIESHQNPNDDFGNSLEQRRRILIEKLNNIDKRLMVIDDFM